MTAHLVSAVDLLPTLLDVVGAQHPQGLDGRSFLPLWKGQSQEGRELVFKEYNENAGGARHPIRSVQSKRFGYLFNPWADGQRVFRTATTGTATYRTMKQMAKQDERIAARLELFEHRVVEEFYDYEHDPDALHNLIDNPKYQQEVNAMRAAMEQWMRATHDHALQPFLQRDNPEALAAYMSQVEKQSAERRAARSNPQKKKQKQQKKNKKRE